MYHDTIHINFQYQKWQDINFDYSFLISKIKQNKFSPITYGELLQKFEEIGFNLKYLKFYDIDDLSTIVYCTYNYQPNFEIFFSAYKKLIQNKNFSITFEYGIIINGLFYPNNMNYFAGIWFVPAKRKSFPEYGLGPAATKKKKMEDLHFEEIIKEKIYLKSMELYQIVDKQGKIIHVELAKSENDFEQHFFENYDVKVAMRKYKLNRLKSQFT